MRVNPFIVDVNVVGKDRITRFDKKKEKTNTTQSYSNQERKGFKNEQD
jgi:hypothetical protein